MNPGIIGLAKFVRDLLTQPEGQVVIVGRHNVRREDFTGLQIVIDAVSAGSRLNSSESYDGDAEVATYSQQWMQPCTVNFYGNEGYDQAQLFTLLAQSQKGYEIQRDSGVAVYDVSTITDVKMLTGDQFSARYELSCNVQYTIKTGVSTLRIDTAQTEIINDY